MDPTDPLMQDMGTTPFDEVPVPKVGVHGNLLKTIISGKFLKYPEPLMVYGLVFGLTLLVSGFTIVGGGRGVFTKIMAVLMSVTYVALAFHFFRET